MIRTAVERAEKIASWIDAEEQGECRCLSWLGMVRLTIAGLRPEFFADFAGAGPFAGSAAVPVGEWRP